MRVLRCCRPLPFWKNRWPELAGWLDRSKRRLLDDAEYGFTVAKEVSRLDVGQTVVIRHGDRSGGRSV